MQNNDFLTRITSLYGYQTSPVVLCIQISVIRYRNTSFYGFHPSSVVLYTKTATLGSDLQVCMGPRPHLSFSACETAWIAPEILVSICRSGFCMQNSALWTSIQVSMDTRPHLWLCACKTATLGLELQVSVGPRPHMWFLQAKQRLLEQNNKSLWIPDMTCRFVHVQERA